MRRTTVGASAGVLLLLGGVLAYCGNTEGPGYIAAGTADSKAPVRPVAPTDDVSLIPLDGADTDATPGDTGERPGGTATGSLPEDARGATPEEPQRPQPPSHGDTSPPTGTTPDTSAPPSSPTPTSTPPSTSTPPPTDNSPALLEVGAPKLAKADVRWCEKVTVEIRNTGGRPVTDGTVTFKTHIIGGLGIDWDTRESTRELPVPLPGGARETHTWKVCVDEWRVPLGMHIDTKDVDVTWK
ncbi:hypothetical protein ABT381_19085 [Streptomyces sp. NPDC000151]|uniref:hypothetical protein n=1 Tax=Streptomyces sp. NPDC000151 TaxID=3154244 RepID=UPI00331AA293